MQKNTSGTHVVSFNSAQRVENMTPVRYRLFAKKDGTTVLQGLFTWQQGIALSGSEWKDIPTVQQK